MQQLSLHERLLDRHSIDDVRVKKLAQPVARSTLPPEHRLLSAELHALFQRTDHHQRIRALGRMVVRFFFLLQEGFMRLEPLGPFEMSVEDVTVLVLHDRFELFGCEHLFQLGAEAGQVRVIRRELRDELQVLDQVRIVRAEGAAFPSRHPIQVLGLQKLPHLTRHRSGIDEHAGAAHTSHHRIGCDDLLDVTAIDRFALGSDRPEVRK